jgi:hypothetical protein
MALQANPTPNELTNAVRALEQSMPSMPILKSTSIASSSWTATSGSEPQGYKIVISDADITENSIVDVWQTNASAEAWGSLDAYPSTVSANGSVTIYAKNAPTVAISVYYSIFSATVIKSYEELVSEAYPGYAILHGTITGSGVGAPPNLNITSGTLAAGNKAVIIDSVTGLASGDPLYVICTGQTEQDASYWGGNTYPSVTPDISANTTLLLWNGSALTSKENGEV